MIHITMESWKIGLNTHRNLKNNKRGILNDKFELFNNWYWYKQLTTWEKNECINHTLHQYKFQKKSTM